MPRILESWITMINCTWWQRCLDVIHKSFQLLYLFCCSTCIQLSVSSPNYTSHYTVLFGLKTIHHRHRIHNLALRNLRFKAGGSVVKNWCSFAFYVIWATVLVSEIHFLDNCDLLFRWHIKLRFYIPIIHIRVKNYKKKTKKLF